MCLVYVLYYQYYYYHYYYDYDYEVLQANFVAFHFPRKQVTHDQGSQGDSFSFLQISNTFLRIVALPNAVFSFIEIVFVM